VEYFNLKLRGDLLYITIPPNFDDSLLCGGDSSIGFVIVTVLELVTGHDVSGCEPLFIPVSVPDWLWSRCACSTLILYHSLPFPSLSFVSNCPL